MKFKSNFFVNSFLKNSFFMLPIIFSLLWGGITGCTKKDEIEKIGNYSLTASDFEDYYATNLERLSRSANVDKKSIAKYICYPDDPSNPRQAVLLAKSLSPEMSYNTYRDMIMVEQVAKMDGFSDRPVIKAMLDYIRRQALVQLYMQEKMEKYIKVTEKEKEEKCKELRKQDPKRIGPLPLDDCLRIAERFITREKFKKYQPMLIEEIKERVQVTKNKDFNKEDYLKNRFKPYQALKKIGKCETPPPKKSDTDSKESKKTK